MLLGRFRSCEISPFFCGSGKGGGGATPGAGRGYGAGAGRPLLQIVLDPYNSIRKMLVDNELSGNAVSVWYNASMFKLVIGPKTAVQVRF